MKPTFKNIQPLQKLLFYLTITRMTKKPLTGEITAIIPNRYNPLTFVAAIVFAVLLTLKDIRINFVTIFKHAYTRK